jgi:L-arabinose isomerase
VFNRAQIDFHQITGTLYDDPEAWDEIDAWIEAARVARVLQNNRVGLLGHYYGGMLDIYSDLTQHSAFFGCHMEHVEMTELKGLCAQVTDDQIEQKIAEIHTVFDVMDDCSQNEIQRVLLQKMDTEIK